MWYTYGAMEYYSAVKNDKILLFYCIKFNKLHSARQELHVFFPMWNIREKVLLESKRNKIKDDRRSEGAIGIIWFGYDQSMLDECMKLTQWNLLFCTINVSLQNIFNLRRKNGFWYEMHEDTKWNLNAWKRY